MKTSNPNNVCVTQTRKLHGDGGPGWSGTPHTAYRVVTRYNYSPEPLGAQHRDPIVGEFDSLAEAVEEAAAVAHFNKQLTPCCSTSLAGKPECQSAGLARR